ncbi:STAS domain-containing protein [Planobispora rosea]|uniref:STAS domain-containing protein n=1 Tax=Planobispora rosea TaxID=35762 RepID=UPI001670D010|nr:STAS domain-containing protein [Planobispora rosea]
MTTALQFASTDAGKAGVLTVKGTLDYTTYQLAMEFFDQAFARFGPDLVVNLLETDFLDSRATGLLVSCWKRAEEEGGRLSLVAVEQGTTRVLWITGVVSRIPVFPTVEAALTAPSSGLTAPSSGLTGTTTGTTTADTTPSDTTPSNVTPSGVTTADAAAPFLSVTDPTMTE